MGVIATRSSALQSMTGHQSFSRAGVSDIPLSVQQPSEFNLYTHKLQETFRQVHTVAEMERRKLESNIFDIRNNLRTKSDTDKKNVKIWNDVGKHQDHKSEIFTIRMSRKRLARREADDDIKVLSRNLLSINFSLEDPRPQNWKPRDPLFITACIRQKQIHRVYIDNCSSTNIIYKHYFRQLLNSWKEGLKPPTSGPLIGFTGHSLWPLGTKHLPSC